MRQWGRFSTGPPAGRIASRQTLEEGASGAAARTWCFPLTYEHPDQGESQLGLLVLQVPEASDDRPSSERLTLWRRLIERGVERINLALSLSSLHDELRKRSIEDGLTGLKNRRFLDETLDREIALAQRQGTPLSVLVCDIDHFKHLNDTHGHAVGDKVLRRVAEHLLSVFRNTDLICRYGGDELVILMPAAEAEDCRMRAETLRQQVASDRIEHAGKWLDPITLSVGIASWPEMVADARALLEQADRALYRAKQGGRNRVETAA